MSDAFLDATAQAELVRRGDASPLELVDAAIGRIEKLNPELNAVITPTFDEARAAASAGPPDGPFRGVPLLLKDLGCHGAGERFCDGMSVLRDLDWREDFETHLARRFREAGFVLCGKTNTPEGGILPTTEPAAFGATRNPWDGTRSPGGSSGGSAAATAAGMVPVAHGNDGGGSIRIPASACGVVGLKPSRGRVSLGPEYGELFGGLPCDGVLTRSVRDTAAVLDVIAGPEPGDPYAAPTTARPYAQEVGADPGSLRIGLLTTAANTAVHDDCVAAATSAARLLESLGHRVETSSPAALAEEAFTPAFISMWSSGAAWNLAYWSRRIGRAITADDVEPLTWALAEMGRSYSAPDYLSAIEWLQGWSRRVASWWADDGFDLLLTPTLAEPPTVLGAFDSPADNPLAGLFRAAALVPFTPPFNVTGQPGISLPLHWNDGGLPIGVQLVAAYGREDLLVRIAAQLEATAPWAHRRPPISA